MAYTAQANRGDVISCGTCLEVEGFVLLNPKRLPCQHIVCVRCLEAQKEDGKIIKCSICK
jgi:hypothetical protein